jgi:hypothetical protein
MSHARHEDSGDEYEAMQLQETKARHSADTESPSLHAAASSESVPELTSESSAPPPPPVNAV